MAAIDDRPELALLAIALDQPRHLRAAQASHAGDVAAQQPTPLAALLLVLLLLEIGIERGRASRRWRVTVLALSVCKAGSQFHRSHVSRGPPIIPDGRISQVRFEVLACRP